MYSYDIKGFKNCSSFQSVIGLLEPMSEKDSLALALAKAVLMSHRGANITALQAELSRIMEPYAYGNGRSSAFFFENVDAISLKNLAYLLDKRQARQLANDVSLAVEELSAKSLPSNPSCQQNKFNEDSLMKIIENICEGCWQDPLAENGNVNVINASSTFANNRLHFFKKIN